MNLLTLIVACLVFTIYGCTNPKPIDHQTSSDTLSGKKLIDRGQYLVIITGCNDCHSPKRFGANGPEIDSSTRLSGFPSIRPIPEFPVSEIKKGHIVVNEDATAAMGPWGTSFAANISSDATGIGNWKEEQFKNAMTHGKFKGLDGSRMLMPTMPWPNFAIMNDEDLKAIFAYLKSTRPVNNNVPAFKPFVAKN
jgi:mono/diheme cytochrome c family protein